jgi:hypothetical protein
MNSAIDQEVAGEARLLAEQGVSANLRQSAPGCETRGPDRGFFLARAMHSCSASV